MTMQCQESMMPGPAKTIQLPRLMGDNVRMAMRPNMGNTMSAGPGMQQQMVPNSMSQMSPSNVVSSAGGPGGPPCSGQIQLPNNLPQQQNLDTSSLFTEIEDFVSSIGGQIDGNDDNTEDTTGQNMRSFKRQRSSFFTRFTKSIKPWKFKSRSKPRKEITVSSSTKSIKKKKKRKVFSSEEIQQAITLLYSGPRTYKILRARKWLPLPHPTTVRKHIQWFECKPGITPELMGVLEKKIESLDENERQLVLIFDEIHLKKTPSYDPHLKCIWPANGRAQVVMLRSLSSHWKLPIFYEFEQHMTKTLLFELIRRIQNYDVIIRACVMDLGNSTLISELQLMKKRQHFFENPSFPKKKIYLVADPPHLLKLIRNHWQVAPH